MGKWCEVKCACPNRIKVHDPGVPHWNPRYLCGHSDGAVVQFWPGYLFEVGKLLRRMAKEEPDILDTYPRFLKVSNFNLYVDEYLALSKDDAELWRTEIDDLLDHDNGARSFPYEIARIWQEFWVEFFADDWHKKDAVSVKEILGDGVKLCEASRQTGNPIEFGL